MGFRALQPVDAETATDLVIIFQPLDRKGEYEKLEKSRSESVEKLTIRLNKELATYYRKLANRKGKPLAEFVRESMAQGLIADTACDFENRMEVMFSKMRNLADSKNLFVISKTGMNSIYICETILSKILGDRNIQDLYEAQDRAKQRLDREMSENRDAPN